MHQLQLVVFASVDGEQGRPFINDVGRLHQPDVDGKPNAAQDALLPERGQSETLPPRSEAFCCRYCYFLHLLLKSAVPR